MSTPSIPEKMKCILIKDGKGPAENMYMGEEAVPKSKDGEVLVKVTNFNDLMGMRERELTRRCDPFTFALGQGFRSEQNGYLTYVS